MLNVNASRARLMMWGFTHFLQCNMTYIYNTHLLFIKKIYWFFGFLVFWFFGFLGTHFFIFNPLLWALVGLAGLGRTVRRMPSCRNSCTGPGFGAPYALVRSRFGGCHCLQRQ